MGGCGGCGGCGMGCGGCCGGCGAGGGGCGMGGCNNNMGMAMPSNSMMQQQMAQMSSMMMPMMMGGGGMGNMDEMMKKMQEMMGMGSKTKTEKGSKKKAKDNANVVFVGGLRKTTEEDRVAAHFAKFGQVEQVDIKRLPDGTSRGFAFIKFAETDAVDKVIEAHAKHMIDNKWVEVKKHDGVAASAGMTESLNKKKADEDEPEEKAENRDDWSEKWSQQYLEMASKLGEMEQGGEKKSSGTSEMEQMMKQMGLDPSMMKQMGMDPKSMQKMMKQMGLDPSMLKMMGMDPSMMMMNMMSMMNPMMSMMGGGMGGGSGGGMSKSMMKQMGMDSNMMQMMGMGKKSDKDGGMPALDNKPMSKGQSPPRGRSGSRHRSRSARRGRSGSANRRPRSPHHSGQRPEGGKPPGLPGMLGAPQQNSLFRPAAPQAPTEDPAKVAARKAAASAAAAAFAMAAGRVAETSRDAARDAATAKAAAPQMQPDPNDRRPVGFESGEGGHGRTWHPDPLNPQMKPPVKLWLPEPTVQEQIAQSSAPELQRHHQPPADDRRRSPRRKSRSKTPRRNRKKSSGGWDNEEAAPAPAPSSFTAQAAPSRPALPPGAAPPMLPGPPTAGGGQVVPVNRFGIPEATPEALAAAVFRAQQVEAAGLEAIRSTGQIPRGPPDLPTGTEVIEQKCVAYLIGKGGQALAAINAAAGVSIQIDQSTKSFGWSMANIYGTEEGAAKAKMILRQKVSEYRPLRA